MRTRRTSRAGFTLVEVLSVVFIIAILIALVFPAFNKQLKAAQAISCAARVKQTGAGILLYAADNANRLPGPMTSQNYTPTYKDTAGPDPGTYGLYFYIWPYVGLPSVGESTKLAKVGVCPAVNNKKDAWLRGSKFFQSQVHTDRSSDTNNTFVIYPNAVRELPTEDPYTMTTPFGNDADGNGNGIKQPWLTTSVPRPSLLALISEMPGNPKNPVRYGEGVFPNIYDTHCNILFLDGHVETRTQHRGATLENP